LATRDYEPGDYINTARCNLPRDSGNADNLFLIMNRKKNRAAERKDAQRQNALYDPATVVTAGSPRHPG